MNAFVRTGPDTRHSCLIANICEGGAKLVFPEGAPVAATFTVLIPVLPNLFDERLADVRWRCGQQLGVRFVEASRRSMLAS